MREAVQGISKAAHHNVFRVFLAKDICQLFDLNPAGQIRVCVLGCGRRTEIEGRKSFERKAFHMDDCLLFAFLYAVRNIFT